MDLSATVAAGVALVVGFISVGFQLWSYLHGERLRRHRVSAEFQIPLSIAARELSSRIHSLIHRGFEQYYVKGLPRHKEYVCENTIFLFGRLFAWFQIVHANRSRLDLRENERRHLDKKLDDIRLAFSSDLGSPVFHLLGGEQQAIGEEFSAKKSDGSSLVDRQCLTYSEYLRSEEVRKHAEPLREYVKIFIAAKNSVVVEEHQNSSPRDYLAKKLRYEAIAKRLLERMSDSKSSSHGHWELGIAKSKGYLSHLGNFAKLSVEAREWRRRKRKNLMQRKGFLMQG